MTRTTPISLEQPLPENLTTPQRPNALKWAGWLFFAYMPVTFIAARTSIDGGLPQAPNDFVRGAFLALVAFLVGRGLLRGSRAAAFFALIMASGELFSVVFRSDLVFGRPGTTPMLLVQVYLSAVLMIPVLVLIMTPAARAWFKRDDV